MAKFTFDGPTLAIIGNDPEIVGGVFEFTVVELYSEWKEWVQTGEGAKYPPAFRVIGGDPIGSGTSVGTYLFIRNDLGWHGHPPFNSGNGVVVRISGNLYPEDQNLSFFDPWPGVTTVMELRNSSLTQRVETSGTDPTSLANAVWSHSSASSMNDKVSLIEKILRNKTVTDPLSGLMTVFDDDGSTVLLTANIWQNASGTVPYSGSGVDKRDRLA